MSTSPRHLINIHQLSDDELISLVNQAADFKQKFKSGSQSENDYKKLLGKTVTLLFSKRSTRTRISCEGASSYFGAHPMFLGKDDIQLGVNESLYDTTKVISSMTECIFARVSHNDEILQLSTHSQVPVINSLCNLYHPLQAITDILTIKEHFGEAKDLKLTWIGDSNNVINDLCIAALKFGINVSICIPSSINFNPLIISKATEIAQSKKLTFEIVNDPAQALKNTNVVVTDTWISMGEELEKIEKLKQFSGFTINQDLLKSANINDNWIFMHCLPRHKEEVDDDVFYSPNSIVFQEAENRLYTAMAVINAFVINKGDLLK